MGLNTLNHCAVIPGVNAWASEKQKAILSRSEGTRWAAPVSIAMTTIRSLAIFSSPLNRYDGGAKLQRRVENSIGCFSLRHKRQLDHAVRSDQRDSIRFDIES